MRGLTLFVVTLASGATSKTEVSPVQKVVELLGGLKGKVEADLANEEKLMGEYSKWCDDEANEKEDAITSGKRSVGDLAATIEDASASIGKLTSEVEELAAKISTADADLKAASDIRQQEHSDFEAAESELVDTIDVLARAIVVLKRGQTSFLQQHGSKDLSMLATGLSKIIEATWVNSRQKAVVQSLIQSTTSSEDEDLSFQPQATTAAFESQGSGILDTLKDMRDKAESTLSGARKDEMNAQFQFEMLKQSLDDELATMKKRMSAASTQKSSTEEAKASASEELSSTQNAVDSDTAYLADCRQNCAAKASEWDERQKSAAGEIAAIEKAKAILEDGVKVFLQVNAKSTSRDESDKRDQVAQILRKIATKDHVYALSQLASAAQSDPFGKVRGLIESMITRLEKEAAEEADAKSFCDSENAKSRKKQADLTATQDMNAVRIEKATAKKAQLQSQIKALQEQMAANDANQAEATSVRNEEHAEYQKSSKDYRDSADAVAAAIETLSAYYNKGSFLQVAVKVGQAPELGGAKSDIAGTIMEMLEVAESDFTRLLAEAESAENSAVAAYDKLSQDNRVAKASNTQEVAGKKGEVKTVEAGLLNYKEDHATTGKELDAVLAYLDKLKPQCETKVMSYAERKARREEEIEGLREALEILQG